MTDIELIVVIQLRGMRYALHLTPFRPKPSLKTFVNGIPHLLRSNVLLVYIYFNMYGNQKYLSNFV